MELVVEAAPPEQVLLFGLLALKWQKSHASALAARARGVYLSNAIMEVGSREGCLLVHGLIERGHSALLCSCSLFPQKDAFLASAATAAGPVAAAAGQCVLIK